MLYVDFKLMFKFSYFYYFVIISLKFYTIFKTFSFPEIVREIRKNFFLITESHA